MVKQSTPAASKAPTSPALTQLGGLSAAQFCAKIWHQKPLLIRQAFTPAQLAALPDRQAVLSLAADPAVQSRLIRIDNGQWSLQNGPFKRLPALKQKDWTLLVQSVNLHAKAADALMTQFDFIERARFDDVMVSYASDGGGVGPHFDSYDVFLLQTAGQRRWRISQQQDLSLVEDLPLKILKNFQATEEFVLDPGDMLYLPPHVAHEGTAVGESITYSIGFRALDHEEALRGFYEFMADVVQADGRLSNRQTTPAKQKARLPASSIAAVSALIAQHQPNQDDVIEYLGCSLTEPKPHSLFALLPETTTPTAGLPLNLAAASLALHSPGWFFINGTSWRSQGLDASLLIRLAEERRLTDYASASPDMQEQLAEWLERGWLITD